MRKNPILIFILIILTLTLGAVVYIQSSHFAGVLKRIAQRSLPRNVGIKGDFEHLKIKLFPPGVAIVNPEIHATGDNPADIPVGTEIRAERLDLIFRPLQIISGRIQVNEVRVVKGNIRTELKPTTKKKSASKLSWEELFQVRADRLDLEDTKVDLGLPEQKLRMNFNARKLTVEKVQGDERTFYDIFLYMDTLRAEVPKTWQYPDQVDSLRTRLELDQEGLRLQSFELVREGTQLLAKGSVKGDVLSGKNLQAELDLELSADLRRMLEFLSDRDRKSAKVDQLPSGHVNFKGVVKGMLDRPQETLQATGFLRGENVAFGNYQFQKAEIEGAYAAKSQGNSVRVKKAVLQSPHVAKKGGHQSGSGGRVEIGAFEFSPERPQPIQTTLRLDDAHIHWLGGIVLKDLYGLDGRITGDAEVKFTPPATPKESFRVEADLKWKITDFQLDNQRLKETKPLTRVLAIPAVNLNGKISVKKDELAFDGPQVSVKNSQFKVGGRIRFLNQVLYEIEAGGPVDLSELTVLAENPVKGTGVLGVRVSGPSDRVFIDFDGDIRDFQYLRLKFGNFRGRISWEDDPNILHFRNLDCSRERTKYGLNGQLNLGRTESMDIRVQVPAGSIHDFTGIFEELVSDLWWFPRKMTGPMTGQMRVHGGISLDEMKVDASIQGAGWEYYGERLKNVSLTGGYDRGKYYLSDFKVQKKVGSVLGRISYDAKKVMSWDVRSEGLLVTDFDHLAHLEVPVRGRIIGRSQGGGPEGNVESLTELQVLDTIVRGKRLPASQLSIVSEKGVANVQGQVADGQARLNMKYDLTEGGHSTLRAEAKNLDFTPGILLLNSSLVQDEKLVGVISGEYELSFQTGNAELGSGSAKLTQYTMAREGSQFTLERPVSFRIDHGSFDIPSMALSGQGGRVNLRLRSQRGQLNGAIQGRVDLALIEFLTPVVESARGQANLDYLVSGSIKKPEVSGTTQLKEGFVKLVALESPFENVEGRLDFRRGLLRVLDLQGDLAGGRIRGEGTIDFFLDRFPKMDLQASLNGSRLKVYPFQVAKVRGTLYARGETLPYLVTGRILVENAISREKLADARSPGLRTALYTPPPRMNVASDFPLFRLDIDVSAPSNVIVQNELLDVEAKGDLKIVGTLENPRPIGTAHAIQGRVLFKDRAFTIQSGKVEFDNPTTINPRFEVVATTEVTNRKIQMVATGRFDRPKIEFSSNPPMPENEILTLLALGFTNEEARRMRGVDRSAYEQGEAASLVLHSLDFNREVQNKTGLQIGIDEAVDERTGQSIFRRSSDETTAAGPKIVIRRRFGDRLDLSVGSTVGVGNSVQREVNAEVKVTRGFSVLGVWDTFEGTNTDDSRRSSYGVDLKVQKRFK